VYSTDREQFEVQLSLLCAGYGVWVGDRPEAYWKGLAKMSLIQFARCVEFALSEEGPEKVPNVHELWKIHKGLRAKGAVQDGASSPPESEYPKWLRRVNLLFLAYLMRRRLGDREQSDINLARRRKRCLELVAIFEEMEAANDPEATLAEMKKRFHAMMARTPDTELAAV
jgi:hypothetical protein